MTSDQPGSFSVDVLRDGDRATITLGGELDMYASGVLNERLSELGDVLEIDVDAGAVTFIDSAGLRALLVAREAARDRGWPSGPVESPGVTWVADVASVTDLLVEVRPRHDRRRPVPRDRPPGRYNGDMTERPCRHRPRRRAGHPDAVGPTQALHVLCGRPLVQYVLGAVAKCGCDRAVVVVGFGADLVVKTLQEQTAPSSSSSSSEQRAPATPSPS